MIITRLLTDHIYCLGASDWRIERFENLFPVPQGMSYNSYLIMDEKIAILDTVDESVRREYLDNLKGLLDGRTPDYLVVNHMEPDHCACIVDVLERYPQTKLVGTKKAIDLFEQFYDISLPERYLIVKNGDTLDLGTHQLHTLTMPMVHWPEVTATYESYTGTLFCADAFGSFAPVTGNIYLDEINYREEYRNEARRYYANIIGKYGPQVAHALKQITTLDIRMIAPLHGLIIRRPEDIQTYLDLYRTWSAYEPEEKGVLLIFGSMYGNTERAMQYFAARLADAGVRNIRSHHVSKSDPSLIVADCWRYSHIVFAAPTYNLGLFPAMEEVIHELHRLQFGHRRCLIIGNHSWASAATKIMKEKLLTLKNMELLAEPHDIRSATKTADEAVLEEFAQLIARDLA